MMKYAMCLLLWAAPVTAQDYKIDRKVVEGCFASADVGETSPACIGAASERCQNATPGGFSTAGMGSCTAAETAVWDEFLNREYQDLRAQMREYDADAFAGDISRADALRDSQRAWIAYRDAECAFNWAMFQEGTLRSLISAGCMLDFTATRALELHNYRELPG